MPTKTIQKKALIFHIHIQIAVPNGPDHMDVIETRETLPLVEGSGLKNLLATLKPIIADVVRMARGHVPKPVPVPSNVLATPPSPSLVVEPPKLILPGHD